MPYHQALPHVTHPQARLLCPWTNSTMPPPPYPMPYPSVWPRYGCGNPSYGLLPYGMLPMHPSMLTFGLLTLPTPPLVLLTSLVISTIVSTILPVVSTSASTIHTLSIAPPVVADENFEEVKAMIMAFQLSVKKYTEIAEVMKHLHTACKI